MRCQVGAKVGSGPRWNGRGGSAFYDNDAVDRGPIKIDLRQRSTLVDLPQVASQGLSYQCGCSKLPFGMKRR